MSNNITPRSRQLRNVGGVRRHRLRSQSNLHCAHHLMSAPKPVAFTAVTPGAVILARVPFADVAESKVRPVVVVDVVGNDVTVLPCTSTTAARFSVSHVALVDLSVAGLGRATCVNRASIVIDRSLLIERRGRLSDRDRANVLGWRPIGPVPA